MSPGGAGGGGGGAEKVERGRVELGEGFLKRLCKISGSSSVMSGTNEADPAVERSLKKCEFSQFMPPF